ncbi:hypothetical protein [Longitalea arenae]|nr:hypothetical protein [Longitalea arenae]
MQKQQPEILELKNKKPGLTAGRNGEIETAPKEIALIKLYNRL